MTQETSAPTNIGVLQRVFGIRREELQAVGWSFAYFFCILSAYYILRPVRDAMAIVSGTETIPWLFTGTFTVMLVASPVFGWIASRFPRKQFLPWVYYFFISNVLLFFLLFRFEEQLGVNQVWIGRSFFVWVSVFNLFVVAVFWSFMADIYTKEQSRRLFGAINAGGSIGAVVGPTVTGYLVVPIGYENLLPISALLLAIGVFCIYRLRQWVRKTDTSDSEENIESGHAFGGSAIEGIHLVFTKKYFSAIAITLILANLVGVVMYNFVAEIIDTSFEGTNKHTQVFARIEMAVSVLAFISQLLLVKISVRKFGIGKTLALLPVISVVGFTLLAIQPVLAVAIGLQILRRSLAYGFSKPASVMLYSVVTAREKYKAQNFVETAIYRFGDLVAAWTFRLLSGLGITGVALLCVPVAVIWGIMSLWIGREYNRLDTKNPAQQTD